MESAVLKSKISSQSIFMILKRSIYFYNSVKNLNRISLPRTSQFGQRPKPDSYSFAAIVYFDPLKFNLFISIKVLRQISETDKDANFLTYQSLTIEYPITLGHCIPMAVPTILCVSIGNGVCAKFLFRACKALYRQLLPRCALIVIRA